jgi:hypothetical protein
LWWLLRIGKAIGQQPYSRNALDTSFACGELQVGNLILAELIEATGNGFANLMLEMESERKQRDGQLAGADSSGGGYSDDD